MIQVHVTTTGILWFPPLELYSTEIGHVERPRCQAVQLGQCRIITHTAVSHYAPLTVRFVRPRPPRVAG